MEIYELANSLAQEIRNSTQYNELKKAKQQLFENKEKKNLIEEFEELKKEVQMLEIKSIENKPIDEESKKLKLAKLYNVLVQNKDIKHYFDLEIAFNQLMYDVNKIIGDAIKDIM